MSQEISPQQFGDATHAIGAHAAVRLFRASKWIWGRASTAPPVIRAARKLALWIDWLTPPAFWWVLRALLAIVNRLREPTAAGNFARLFTLGMLIVFAASAWFVANAIPSSGDEGGMVPVLEMAGLLMLAFSMTTMILAGIMLMLIIGFIMRL